jgi:hypothetical protein
VLPELMQTGTKKKKKKKKLLRSSSSVSERTNAHFRNSIFSRHIFIQLDTNDMPNKDTKTRAFGKY